MAEKLPEFIWFSIRIRLLLQLVWYYIWFG